MVSQKHKLLAAGAVLAVGLGLALIFRRTERSVVAMTPAPPPQIAPASSPVTPLAANVLNSGALDGQFSPLDPLPATAAGLVSAADETPLPEADASTVDIDSTSLPGTPEPTLPAAPSATSATGRPVYAPIEAETEGEVDSPYRIHVVHENDSLERLAERYLSDGGRSLELFDLNRDVLDNPHLLPIGAELRIPVEHSPSSD